jgi:hypothetical protein
MQTLLSVLPHGEKFDRIGVEELNTHTECRDVDDRAFPPLVRWLILNMAMAHPKGRLAFCPSAILHDVTSQGRQVDWRRRCFLLTGVDQSPCRLEQHREKEQADRPEKGLGPRMADTAEQPSAGRYRAHGWERPEAVEGWVRVLTHLQCCEQTRDSR